MDPKLCSVTQLRKGLHGIEERERGRDQLQILRGPEIAKEEIQIKLNEELQKIAFRIVYSKSSVLLLFSPSISFIVTHAGCNQENRREIINKFQ